MIDIGDNPFGEKKLDPERKAKVFEIAKGMKKNCYALNVVWSLQHDCWIVTCTASINGQVYDSSNALDAFGVKDHVDMFKHAFAMALKDYEKDNKESAIIH